MPWLRQSKIPVMAYSPIEQSRLLSNPKLTDFSKRHGMTPAQAALIRNRTGFVVRLVSDLTPAERQAMVERLAEQLLKKFGAPDFDAARLAAEEEVAFAAALCDHPPQTLLAVQRSVEDGEIRERFRTLKPREAAEGADRLHAHARAFTYHEIEDGAEPGEEVDLLGLMGKGRIGGNST